MWATISINIMLIIILLIIILNPKIKKTEEGTGQLVLCLAVNILSIISLVIIHIF